MYRNNCYETNKNYGIMADKIKTDALVHSEQYVSCVSFYFYCFFFFSESLVMCPDVRRKLNMVM